MEYDPDQDPDDPAREQRDRADREDPLAAVMALYEEYREDGSLPVQTTRMEPDREQLYAFPEAAYEDGAEQEVGRFTSVILNHTDLETYEHDQEEPPLAELGFDLFPGQHLIVSVDTEALAPRAVGRVTNRATARGGRHNAFGYQADGRLHNEGTVRGNMAEHSYGLVVNDGTVTGSMARDGWEQKPTAAPTSINRGTVEGLYGTGTHGLHINAGNAGLLPDTMTSTTADTSENTVIGTVEQGSRTGGLDGVHINLGDMESVYAGISDPGDSDGIVIDPGLDEDQYGDVAGTVIGHQTLDEQPDLREYIGDWAALVQEPVEELFAAMEELDPDYDPAQRQPSTSIAAKKLIGVDEHGDRDRMERAEHELRRRQQPHPGRYVEAVVREELGMDQPAGIEQQDVQEHRRTLRKYGDR